MNSWQKLQDIKHSDHTQVENLKGDFWKEYFRSRKKKNSDNQKLKIIIAKLIEGSSN